MELRKAVEDLYTNEWVLSHFSVHCRSNTDAEPLLQESALSSSNMGSCVINTCSNIEHREIVDPFVNSSISNEYAILEARKNGYSQTSFSTSMKKIETLYPNRASLERSSANPLFRASQSLRGVISPESQNNFHDASDLENAYSPCWNSTEMSLDEQLTLEPESLRHGNDDDMVVDTREITEIAENYWSLYDGASYANRSVNLDEYDNDMNTYEGFEDLSQSPMVNGIELIAPQSRLQTLTEGSRESLSTTEIESHSKAGADEDFVQGNVDSIPENFFLNEEDTNLSLNLTWVPNLESGTQVGDEAGAAAGMPILNIKFEQGVNQLQHDHPFDSEGIPLNTLQSE